MVEHVLEEQTSFHILLSLSTLFKTSIILTEGRKIYNQRAKMIYTISLERFNRFPIMLGTHDEVSWFSRDIIKILLSNSTYLTHRSLIIRNLIMFFC